MSDSDLSHYLIVKVAGVKFISLNIVNGLMLRQIYKMQSSDKGQLEMTSAYASANHFTKLQPRKLKDHQYPKTLQFSLPHRRSTLRQPGQLTKLSQTIDISREQNEKTEKEEEIYFSKTKKYNYMKQIIDKYFEEGKRDKSTVGSYSNNPEDYRLSNASIPRISKASGKDNLQAKDGLQAQAERGKRVLGHLARRKSKEDSQDFSESLTGSRLLMGDKIQDQRQIQVTKSLSFTHKNSCTLPPINEIMEDKDEEQLRYDSISYLNDSMSQLSDKQPLPLQQNKIKISQNEIYIVQGVLVEGKVNHRIKTYFEKGMPILAREIKAQSLGVEPYWIQYKYDSRCMISPPGPTLRELLFKARKMDADSKFFTLRPKKYYKKLMSNSCQELKRVLIDLCLQLKKVEGKIVNNKINTGNLFIGKNQNLRIGEWGFGFFRETHLIQGIDFENRLDPIFKSKQEWFIPPEYMSPELLRAVALGQQSDLASLGSAPDVWSLGICMFEIATMIPVWMTQKCLVMGRDMVARNGVLAVGGRDVRKMLKRQQKLPWLIKKALDQEWEEGDSKIVDLICRCVDYLPENRPSYEQIIQLLK